MSVKFLEASVEWETTRKDHSKSKDFTVRRLKLLMASHNISFVLLIDKEFDSMSCCYVECIFNAFLFLCVLLAL